MQLVALIVEQLDRAIRELANDHPISDRLALILVDNAVELLVHERLAFHLAVEKHAQQLTPKQRIQARGRRLPPRLKVLEHLKDLSTEERKFIDGAHEHRNANYHAGLRHETVIRAVVGRYFDVACDLFVRLDRGFIAHYSGDAALPASVLPYLGVEHPDEVSLGLDKAAVAARLRAALPKELPPLQATLAEAAHEAINKVASTVEFLVEENPRHLNADKMIVMAQYQYDFEQALAEKGVDGWWGVPGYNDQVLAVRRQHLNEWKPTHRSVPIVRWRACATVIDQEPNALTAMDLYRNLRSEMRYLEEALDEAGAGLDAWIQDQIDISLGK
jgi:hypothetical protein